MAAWLSGERPPRQDLRAGPVPGSQFQHLSLLAVQMFSKLLAFRNIALNGNPIGVSTRLICQRSNREFDPKLAAVLAFWGSLSFYVLHLPNIPDQNGKSGQPESISQAQF